MQVKIPYETLMNGDVNQDGDLDVVDATLIQRYLNFMRVNYPIGEYITV